MEAIKWKPYYPSLLSQISQVQIHHGQFAYVIMEMGLTVSYIIPWKKDK